MKKPRVRLETIRYRPTHEPYHANDEDGEVTLVQGFVRGIKTPVGVAHVTTYRGGGGYLEFIDVDRRWRRRGIGTQLIRACQRKWPDFELSAPISLLGEAFCAAVDSEPIESLSTPQVSTTRRRTRRVAVKTNLFGKDGK